MAKIISIGTAVPKYKHRQEDILHFMQQVYAMDDVGKRKLKFLYHQSGIDNRYSVVPDYSRCLNDWKFYPQSENLEPFPSLEKRMIWFNKYAAPLSVDAIRSCIEHKIHPQEITHLITVSCTGMSAPGLDLQVMDLMDLPKNIYRTSVNFMGCYAAIHAMKMAGSICNSEKNSKVLIVCTELCTLHFQREGTMDNITSSMLFGDGAAAALITNDDFEQKGLVIKDFYSEIISRGKKDMAWELSSSGFLMTLSGYIPELIEEDFQLLVEKSLQKAGVQQKDISNWCIHPGGKRILEAIHKSLHFSNGQLKESYEVLNKYGNMSSPTILFVLKEIMSEFSNFSPPGGGREGAVFGAAFGPGLTMETFVASVYA
ncbi:MAG: type III polyketide synthase [Sphingobacteriales bacterium]|nr:type III polyketide synthase [Sphingobacteriales bacterium]